MVIQHSTGEIVFKIGPVVFKFIYYKQKYKSFLFTYNINVDVNVKLEVYWTDSLAVITVALDIYIGKF